MRSRFGNVIAPPVQPPLRPGRMLLTCGALPHGAMFAPRPVTGPAGQPTPRVIMNPKCFAFDGAADAGATRARFIASLPSSSPARRLYTAPASFIAEDESRVRAEFEWQVATLQTCLDEHERRCTMSAQETTRVTAPKRRGLRWLWRKLGGAS